jgi:hypothetical protein
METFQEIGIIRRIALVLIGIVVVLATFGVAAYLLVFLAFGSAAFGASDSQLAVLLAFAVVAVVIPAIAFIRRDWKYVTGHNKSSSGR